MITRMLVATTALAFLASTPAGAADLRLSPPMVTMKIPRGESGATTIAGNVGPQPTVPLTAILQLRYAGGSMPSTWMSAGPATFVNHPMPLLLPLTISVPGAARPGTYTAHVQTAVLNSSIALTPSAPVLLFVTVPGGCAEPPTVSIVSTQPAELAPPNGRLEDITIAGSITAPDDCAIVEAWYTLSDEYGFFDATGALTAGANGSFSFNVPVQASRRGDDRDGRSYQITVYAVDEAGTGSSNPAIVTVRHDQRTAK